MREYATPHKTHLINEDGVIAALVTNEFGFLFVEPSDAEQVGMPELRAQAGKAALAAPFTDEAKQYIEASTRMPIFVDIRDMRKTSNEDYWFRMASSPYWREQDEAWGELLSEAIESDIESRAAGILAVRGLCAVSELKMGRHFNREPSESDHVGFDPALWPMRLFAVGLSQPFTLSHYYRARDTQGGTTALTWEQYDRALPLSWDHDEALLFDLPVGQTNGPEVTE